MNGLDATMQIRQFPHYSRTPTVAMPGNAFTEDRKRFLEAGMRDFLAKPFRPREWFQLLLKRCPGLRGTP